MLDTVLFLKSILFGIGIVIGIPLAVYVLVGVGVTSYYRVRERFENKGNNHE